MRKILAVILVAFTFFMFQGFGYVNNTQALAETIETPEGIYYKGTPDLNSGSGNIQKGKQQVDKAGNKLKTSVENLTDNVKEKLNLNEELPRSTKEFLRDTEETVEDRVAPITGTKKGYYQDN
jgi:hypothetical protein